MVPAPNALQYSPKNTGNIWNERADILWRTALPSIHDCEKRRIRQKKLNTFKIVVKSAIAGIASPLAHKAWDIQPKCFLHGPLLVSRRLICISACSDRLSESTSSMRLLHENEGTENLSWGWTTSHWSMLKWTCWPQTGPQGLLRTFSCHTM